MNSLFQNGEKDILLTVVTRAVCVCNFFHGMSMYSCIKFSKHSCTIAFICIVCIVIALHSAKCSSAAEFTWSEGDRVHVVVARGSAISIESGHITELYGDFCRVQWDLCDCETVVPLEQAHRTLRAAQKKGAMHDADEESFRESAQSAGKLSLLYMLLSRRGTE